MHPAPPSSGQDVRPLPRFSVVDIETSGFSARRHRILQLGLVVVEGTQIVDEWSSLVQLRWPWQRVGPRHVHGLERRALRHAPPARAVLIELAQRLDGTVFTAHNVGFDWSFIRRAAARAGIALPPVDRLCTLQLSRRLDPKRSSTHRLADLCERYAVRNSRPHDALCDARATAGVLVHLLAAHGVADGAALQAFYEP